jgi:ferredoxin
MNVKVRIDPIRCRGHAICSLLTEGVELDDWGYGRVVDASPEGRDGLRRARRAAAACPNGAIVITGVEQVALGRRRRADRRR